MLALTGEAGLLARAELERRPERFEQALGDQLGAGLERELLADHDELVAAQAPERVGAAHDAVEPRGDGLQQLVAGGVPERVVDGLEVVEIDEQGRDLRLAARAAREHLLDAIEDQRPVRQAGQRVVRRQERELLLASRELFIGSLDARCQSTWTSARG